MVSNTLYRSIKVMAGIFNFVALEVALHLSC